MIENDYYSAAQQRLKEMRGKVACSKKSDGKELVEGLSEINLAEVSKKNIIAKPVKELGA